MQNTCIAGQEEFSSMQDQWMREGKGFLLVYTIISKQSLEEVELFNDFLTILLK